MEKKNILLVEDDLNLGTILKEFLEVKGFNVNLCINGEEASDIFKAEKFDICILDIMMPKKDGFTLAKEIRKDDQFTPIVFLTAKSLQSDKLEGLRLGADDYITKPFSTEELFLRINTILKRINTFPDDSSVSKDLFNIGKYKFDYNHRLLTLKENEKKLTSKEADLLKLLCLMKNNVLERSYALKTIWHDDNYFTARSMDVYIVKLRNYLKEDKSIEIANVHGTGFKLLA